MIKRISFVIAWLWVVAVLGMAGWWVWEWLPERQERILLAIESHRVPELAEPVFAQFVFTQTLNVPELTLVSRLRVPVYIPESGRILDISLMRDGEVLESWETPAREAGLAEVDLPFQLPRLLEGDLELVFDGTAIAHADQGVAPRVFIESFDAAYPEGNYRIAENEKKGDISLSVYEIVTNQELLTEKHAVDPLGVLADWLLWLTGLVMVSLFPFAILRTIYSKEGEGDRSGSDRDKDPKG